MAADDSLVSWGPSPTYGELVRINFVNLEHIRDSTKTGGHGKNNTYSQEIFKYCTKVRDFESVGKNENVKVLFDESPYSNFNNK